MKFSPVSPPRIVVASAALFIAALSGKAHAQQINWGNTVNSVNVDSNGVPLDNATFTYQLGTFSNGDGPPPTEFIPTAANTDFWGSAWVALDTATYNETNNFFSGSYTVADNTYEGFQAYIWVYNNQIGDATSEWVLITDDTTANAWKIPTSTGNQQVFPDQWRTSTATTPYFGALDDVEGPGEHSTDPPSGYEIQTYTFLPVPEPGIPVFGMFAAAVLFFRRSRK